MLRPGSTALSSCRFAAMRTGPGPSPSITQGTPTRRPGPERPRGRWPWRKEISRSRRHSTSFRASVSCPPPRNVTDRDGLRHHGGGYSTWSCRPVRNSSTSAANSAWCSVLVGVPGAGREAWAPDGLFQVGERVRGGGIVACGGGIVACGGVVAVPLIRSVNAVALLLPHGPDAYAVTVRLTKPGQQEMRKS
jgi:hypothetical protein